MKSLNFGVNNFICSILLFTFFAIAIFLFYIQTYLLAVIFLIGVICGVYCLIFPQDELTKITNKNNIVSFFAYENKKLRINQYKYEEIEKFHITFIQIHEEKISKFPPPLDLIFIVKNFNKEEQVYNVRVHGHYSIKQIFEFTKDIPNFAYNVETNRDVTLANIENIAKTGKELSLKDALNIVEKDSNVATETKTILKLGIVYTIITLCVVIIMILSIIKDVIIF